MVTGDSAFFRSGGGLTRRALSYGALLLSGTAWAAPGWGQAAPAPQVAAEGPAAQAAIDPLDIVVTARRRLERLLDVPVAANALNAAALQRYATADLTNVGLKVPQLNIDRVGFGNGAVISIRGIGSAAVDAAIESEVTVNIDGIPISRGRVVTQALFDIQSVEVLKGPQALFFGKNSPAGVISVNSENGGQDFGGYGRIGYEFNAREAYAEGAASAPLAQGLTVRVAGRYSNMFGGFIKNDSLPITDPTLLPLRLVQAGLTLPGAPQRNYPGTRDLVGRLSVHYDDNGPFTATFKFLGSQHKDDGYSMGTVIVSCGEGQTRPSTLDIPSGRYLQDPTGHCKLSDHSSTGTLPAAIAAGYPGSNGGVPFVNTVSYLSSLTLGYKLAEDIALTSVTGYYKYRERGWGNFDYTSFVIASGKNDDSQRTVSEELRLQTSFSSPLNASAGLFFSRDRRTYDQDGAIGYFGVDAATGRTDSTAQFSTFHNKTFSGYAQLSWKIAPELELAGGARYTREHKEGNFGNTYITPALAAAYLPPSKRLIGGFSEKNTSPEVTLTWKPQKDLMIYGAYKTGFKSGGFSSPTRYPANATLTNQRFGQEKVKGGEIGIKFSELDRALTGDVTAYHYIYSGLQLTAYNGANSSYFTQNAGSATASGVEANLNYRLTPEVSLRGSAAYNRARYESFPGSQCFTGQTAAEGCVGGVQNLAGKPLSRAPKYTLLGGITYDVPVGEDWTVGVTTDARYTSGYFISTNNSPYSYQKGFGTIDASLRLYDKSWELSLIGRNLTDKIYAVWGTDKPLGPRGQVAGYIGRTREILLQLSRKF